MMMNVNKSAASDLNGCLEGLRVFVSGGAGVIGSEIVPLLIESGAEVMAGDLKPRPKTFSNNVLYRQGDLNQMTAGELASFAPNVFIHLAATFERSAESYEFWEENFKHNVSLSHHLMTLVKDLPSLRRVIFASSYLIYSPELYHFDDPQAQSIKLSENSPITPRNLTGMAKLAHEIELDFLSQYKADSFSTTCVRIYRGYGCNSRDVISRWVRSLIAGETIKVYQPEGRFDYIYAKDTAKGLVKLAALSKSPKVLNLGTGLSRQVGDVVKILRDHFPSMKVEYVTSDLQFEASEANMELYKSLLNWLPEYSLESAINEIVDFERIRFSSQEKRGATTGNALVTSASKKVPLIRAVQHAAKRIGGAIQVIAGDVNENALTKYVADQFWLMPRCIDEELEAIISGCLARSVRLVVPTRDGELLFWAKYKHRFAENGIEVLVSSTDSIERCFDKLKFSEFGLLHCLPVIPASEDIDSFQSKRYVVKERFGAGARDIGLDLTMSQAKAHAIKLQSPIYQPYIVGLEVSVDSWIDRAGGVKGIVMRSRDQVVSGESQVTTTFRDSGIQEIISKTLQAFSLYGPVVLQAIIDDDGRAHIIECNARFGGGSTASIAAGLDVFYWSLLQALGAQVDDCVFTRNSVEVRQVRVSQDLYIYGSDI